MSLAPTKKVLIASDTSPAPLSGVSEANERQ